MDFEAARQRNIKVELDLAPILEEPKDCFHRRIHLRLMENKYKMTISDDKRHSPFYDVGGLLFLSKLGPKPQQVEECWTFPSKKIKKVP